MVGPAFVLNLPATLPSSSTFLGRNVSGHSTRRVLASRYRVHTPLKPTCPAPHVCVSMQIVDEQKLLDIRAKEVFMPALSSTMTEGVIVAWLKKPGDRVEVGEMIMTVESDKADMDVESFESGYLASILIAEGASAPVGATVALIADNKEDIPRVQECGLDCIVSGSGNRHDGTTAVMDRSGSETANSSTPSARPQETPSSGLVESAVTKPDLCEVWMPALSSTMETGKIDAYYVEVGAVVEKGQIIMAVESDKASMDVEAFDSGVLAHIAVNVGEEAKVGDAVAYLAKSEADVPAVQAWAKSLSSAPESSISDGSVASSGTAGGASRGNAASMQSPVATSAPPVVNTGRIIASPLAKVRGRELNVDLSRVQGTGPNGRIVEADVVAAAAATGASAAAPARRADGKIIATPDAKKVAKAENIDLAKVVGSGNFGRITAEDVLKAAGKSPVAKTSALDATTSAGGSPKKLTSSGRSVAPPPEGSVPMTAMQKAVVQNMNASLTVPVFRVAYSIRTTAFDELYAQVKAKGVTVSAMLAKAVAITLTKHPIMNAVYGNESIVYRPHINIAMAVALPDGGLITPTLQDADKTDLYSLSRSWKDLVKRATEKSLKANEYSSGTFVLSNLGMYGVESFDAILPAGVGSILAVSASKPVVGMQSSGLIGLHKEMVVNITCDHRHIYGANAAEFLRDLASLIEDDVQQLIM